MNAEPDFVRERTLRRRIARRIQAACATAPRREITPQRPIGLGLLGLGNVARWQHLPWLRRHPGDFRLVSVFDVDEARATQVAAEFGAQIATGADELAAQPDVEAVLVCTPTSAHVEGILSALRHNKHVLSEKPLTEDVGQAQRLWEAARRSRRLATGVNFNLRFRPEFQLIRAIVRHGTIGDVHHLWGSLSQGGWFSASGRPSDERADAAPWKFDAGGVLFDLTPHAVDLIRWWLGEIAGVQAWAQFLPAKQISSLAACGISFELVSGARVQLLSSRLATGSKEQTAFEINGARGAVRFREGAVQLWTRDVPRWRTLLAPVRTLDPLAAFAAAIRHEPTDAADFRDGCRNTEILTAIHQSALSGRLVRLRTVTEKAEQTVVEAFRRHDAVCTELVLEKK